MKFKEMIGRKWLEVKDEMISYIIVDKDNIDKETGACIVDFINCEFLSVNGTYKIENDEIIITIVDEATMYNNGSK